MKVQSIKGLTSFVAYLHWYATVSQGDTPLAVGIPADAYGEIMKEIGKIDSQGIQILNVYGVRVVPV